MTFVDYVGRPGRYGRRSAKASPLAKVVMVAALFAGGGWLGAEQGLLDDLLTAPLSHRFERAGSGELSAVAGIIALGGPEQRVVEAGNLARRLRNLNVYVLGAGEAANVIGLLGPELESQRITVEERSKNTYENAMFLRDYVTPRTEQKWLLVTSAVHMPRAVGVFRKAGFDVEPWPISDLTDEEEAMPLKYAIHEWLGLLGYRLLGRIEEIFPAPRKSSTASNMTTATAGP